MRRLAVIAAAVGASLGVLAVPPRTPPAAQTKVVVENRGVLADGIDVALGTRVDALPDRMSREAYDARTGDGLVQVRGAIAPILLIARGGVVRAISIADVGGVRTSEGIVLGDDESRLSRAYGGRLSEAKTAFDGVSGYFLSGNGALTVFDTACTGTVNAIGIAQRPEGVRALADLWGSGACSDAG